MRDPVSGAFGWVLVLAVFMVLRWLAGSGVGCGDGDG